jgi:hypothetical protein
VTVELGDDHRADTHRLFEGLCLLHRRGARHITSCH